MLKDQSAASNRSVNSLFANEEPTTTVKLNKEINAKNNKKWKIMVIDDDEAIHRVSRLVFGGFQFMGQAIEVIYGQSGAEARELIRKHPDTALILLDVVMETDQAGLEVVNYIRQELKNKCLQIILRTGQPGLAPETTIVRDYEINGYTDKYELTVEKLTTAVITALRVYRDMKEVQSLTMQDESLNKMGPSGRDGTHQIPALQQVLRVMNCSSSVVSIKNSEGRYVLVNSQFEQLFNVNYEAALGKTDHEVMPTKIADQIVLSDKAVSTSNETLQFNDSFIQNGKKRAFITIKFPLYNAQHVSFGVCSISTRLPE